MGRTVTPKYVVVLDGKDFESMVWDVKSKGRPTVANLEKFVMSFAKSLEAGGVNVHISESLGYVPYPRTAAIKFNYRGGPVVAEWKAAMFQVYA